MRKSWDVMRVSGQMGFEAESTVGAVGLKLCLKRLETRGTVGEGNTGDFRNCSEVWMLRGAGGGSLGHEGNESLQDAVCSWGNERAG